jgi:hypothetical protein
MVSPDSEAIGAVNMGNVRGGTPAPIAVKDQGEPSRGRPLATLQTTKTVTHTGSRADIAERRM